MKNLLNQANYMLKFIRRFVVVEDEIDENRNEIDACGNGEEDASNIVGQALLGSFPTSGLKKSDSGSAVFFAPLSVCDICFHLSSMLATCPRFIFFASALGWHRWSPSFIAASPMRIKGCLRSWKPLITPRISKACRTCWT
uniref:BdORF39-PA n=1 Tax=Boechera divaricarpa TaxID=115915 RepID=B6REM3_9BRAS|nr:BdORF39-PA [Boechera divaricarpa]